MRCGNFRDIWSFDKLSNTFYQKIQLAINWYADFIDPVSGNAPNIGPNDGTYLFNYNQVKYRDFTTTLSLCCLLFNVKPTFRIKQKHVFENLFDLNPDKTLFDSGCSIDTSVKSFLKLPRKKAWLY